MHYTTRDREIRCVYTERNNITSHFKEVSTIQKQNLYAMRLGSSKLCIERVRKNFIWVEYVIGIQQTLDGSH